MATKITSLASIVLNSADAARLISKSPRWLYQLVADGFVKKSGSNYRPADVVAGYAQFLLDDKRGKAKSTTQQSVQKARAREIELRTKRAENEVIDTEESIAVMDEIIGTLKSTLDGLAASAVRDQQLQRSITEKIDAALQRAADTLAQRAASLRKHGTATGDQEDEEVI